MGGKGWPGEEDVEEATTAVGIAEGTAAGRTGIAAAPTEIVSAPIVTTAVAGGRARPGASPEVAARARVRAP